MQKSEFELYFLEPSLSSLPGDSLLMTKFLSSFHQISSLVLWCVGVFFEIDECTVDVDGRVEGIFVFGRKRQGASFFSCFTLHPHVPSAVCFDCRHITVFCLWAVPFEHQASSLIFATTPHSCLEIPQFLRILTVDLLIFSKQPILLRIGHLSLSFSTRQ